MRFLRADFADVNHALNAFSKLHEGAKLRQARHRPFDHRARRKFFCHSRPGIAQRLLQAERDAAFSRVHSENHGFDGLAPVFHYVGWSSYSLSPRHFGNMNQTFNARIEFHKRAVIGEPGNRAAHPFRQLYIFRRRRPMDAVEAASC